MTPYYTLFLFMSGNDFQCRDSMNDMARRAKCYCRERWTFVEKNTCFLDFWTISIKSRVPISPPRTEVGILEYRGQFRTAFDKAFFRMGFCGNSSFFGGDPVEHQTGRQSFWGLFCLYFFKPKKVGKFSPRQGGKRGGVL